MTLFTTTLIDFLAEYGISSKQTHFEFDQILNLFEWKKKKKKKKKKIIIKINKR